MFTLTIAWGSWIITYMYPYWRSIAILWLFLALARTVWTWHKWVQAVQQEKLSAPWNSTLNSWYSNALAQSWRKRHVHIRHVQMHLLWWCSHPVWVILCHRGGKLWLSTRSWSWRMTSSIFLREISLAGQHLMQSSVVNLLWTHLKMSCGTPMGIIKNVQTVGMEFSIICSLQQVHVQPARKEEEEEEEEEEEDWSYQAEGNWVACPLISFVLSGRKFLHKNTCQVSIWLQSRSDGTNEMCSLH